jgi:excisionase family DNA binding protein
MSADKSNNQDKRAFTVTQAAVYVGVSRATIQNWVVNNLLPFEELPGRGQGAYRFRLIRKADIDLFLNDHYKTPEKAHNTKTREKLILLPKGA